MLQGILIKESLEDVSVIESLSVTDTKVVTIDNPAEGQSPTWTLVYFEVSQQQVEEVAAKLSKALAPGKWFIDIKSDTDVYVVFLNKVFHYKKGDMIVKQAAIDHALSIGIPESQLGW
ncbi:MAG TPA: hypothetical protein VJJ20_02750 [Candidatus Paceibacterota bacterium]